MHIRICIYVYAYIYVYTYIPVYAPLNQIRSVIRLICNSFTYNSFFTAPPQFNTYFKNSNFYFTSPPFSNILFMHQPWLLIFHSMVFLSNKKSLLLNICDDVILHVICELSPLQPQSKILATLGHEFKTFLCLVIFIFNQSKNNVVLEPRTGHFQGLVGSRPRT